jgi:hypothetical protein
MAGKQNRYMYACDKCTFPDSTFYLGLFSYLLLLMSYSQLCLVFHEWQINETRLHK